MNKDKLISDLKLIKKSICTGAGGGVTDCCWLQEGSQETIVERIDFMLEQLGCDYDELEAETQTYYIKGASNE